MTLITRQIRAYLSFNHPWCATLFLSFALTLVLSDGVLAGPAHELHNDAVSAKRLIDVTAHNKQEPLGTFNDVPMLKPQEKGSVLVDIADRQPVVHDSPPSLPLHENSNCPEGPEDPIPRDMNMYAPQHCTTTHTLTGDGINPSPGLILVHDWDGKESLLFGALSMTFRW
jgi:hypothetical protein